MLVLKSFLDDLTAEAVFVFNSLPQRFSPGETVRLIFPNPPGEAVNVASNLPRIVPGMLWLSVS